ncbi:MAG: [LysW]-lysine hydrolase [Pirellulaceae bacterium]|nr:[LysW]-lysine hydrolase [Pirellulaceae bacterium]
MNPSPPAKIDDARCHQFLKNLVAIPSLSGHEKAASEYLVSQFQELGYESCYLDSVNNAIGIRGQDQARMTIMLLGHIDTVPGDIPVRIENGELHGRGSVDAKGSLATFALAAAQVALPPGIRLVVVGAVEEESATSKGARQIARDFTADYCLIGEPSSAAAITLGYKGRILLDYHHQVAMAHSAGPEKSAAELAAGFWQQTRAHCDEFNADKTRLFEQLLPSLRSINSQSDGLDATAECKIGIRLPPNFDIDALRDRLTEFAKDGQVTFYGYEAAHQSDRSHALCRALAGAIRETGAKPKYKLKTGTADMNVVAPIWKCPILAYGPGDSSLDHTPQERLPLSEFTAAIKILTSALNRLVTNLSVREDFAG